MSAEAALPRRKMTRVLPDETATRALGDALADWLVAHPGGLVVYLSGPLGSGKTALVRAALRRLGVTGRIKSPTFTLVEPYVLELPALESRERLRLYCYHFDFYRFTDANEWLDAGFRDYFDGTALCLVEWPERARASGHLPTPDVQLDLRMAQSTTGTGREVDLASYSERGDRCLEGVASSSTA